MSERDPKTGRWMKAEPRYGRSPAENALADIAALQDIQRHVAIHGKARVQLPWWRRWLHALNEWLK
jgi:hypothetical protein